MSVARSLALCRALTSVTRRSASIHSMAPNLQTNLYLHNRVMSTSAYASVWMEQRKYENILTSIPAEGVAQITLNRPKALNALCAALVGELNEALDVAEKDDNIRAVVITGSEKAFAAGADIKEMKDKSYNEVYKVDFLSVWHRLSDLRKPTIAAVSGYALGGGCEIALMCDIVLASPTAQFGQPEIDLGIIPGAGGTQRLTQAVGKSRAMELVLTGRRFSAAEAVAWGVANRVVGEGEGQVVKEAVELAKVIASKGALSVQAGKEAVKASLELPLSEGLRYERRLFHGLFATQDQKEGMAAFAEKRKPKFSHL